MARGIEVAGAMMMLAAPAGAARLPAPVLPLRIDGVPGASPRPAVVILWATWCANCIGELKRLSALAAAAEPLPVLTLAIDPPDRARRAMAQAGLDRRNAFADPGAAGAVLAKWGGSALPLAVAVDADGRVCGRKHGLLGTDQMRQWAKTCLR